MWRRSNMDNIQALVLDKVTEVMECLKSLIQFGLTQLNTFLQMLFVYITYRNKTTSIITRKMVTRTTYTSSTDNSLGQLVTRRNIAFSSQYFSGNYGKESQCTHSLEKISSLLFHIFIIYNITSIFLHTNHGNTLCYHVPVILSVLLGKWAVSDPSSFP